MQIVFVTPSLKTGGGNRVFIELANILCQDYSVEIIYSNNSQEHHTFASNPRIKYRAVGKYSQTKLGKLWNVFSLIRTINRQYKDAYVIFTDPLFSVFSRWLHVKHLYRFIQADDYHLFDDGLVLKKGVILQMYKHLCLRSYRLRRLEFIFNSRFTYDQFITLSCRGDVPCRIIHPAVNHTVFRSQTKHNSGLRICLVARKHPLKGLITFIEAYRSMPQDVRNCIEQVTLISPDDLSAFDTTDTVIYKPENDAGMAKAYQESDIFVFPSWMEGFGLPPLEAMACGCACILSRSGGVDEFARDEENCLMFTPKQPKELRRQLERLLGSEALRRRVSEVGKQTAEMFSWNHSARQLLKILNG